MRKFGTFALLALIWLSIAPVVSAHVLKSDGTIGAVMHVDPDDDPIAGQISNFFFEFKDTTGRFSLGNCNCKASIQTGGKEIFSTSLNAAASFSFTFPQKDIYTVSVIGTPRTAGAFQPFTFKYDLRVARAAAPQYPAPATAPNHLVHYIFFAIPFAIIFGIYFYDLYRARRNNSNAVKLKTVTLAIVPALLLHQAILPMALHHAAVHIPTDNHECCVPQAAILEELPAPDPMFSTVPSHETPVTQQVTLVVKEVNNKSPPLA